IQDRFLPDKAIDLIDEAGSKKNLQINHVDMEDLDNKISDAEVQKQAALRNEDYEKAAYYRDQVTKFQKMKDGAKNEPIDKSIVSEKDIQKIVEEKTNIPVGELQSNEQAQLKNLEPDLKAHLIGQDKAVGDVARAI